MPGAQFILHHDNGTSEQVIMKIEGEGVEMMARWSQRKQTLKTKSKFHHFIAPFLQLIVCISIMYLGDDTIVWIPHIITERIRSIL